MSSYSRKYQWKIKIYDRSNNVFNIWNWVFLTKNGWFHFLIRHSNSEWKIGTENFEMNEFSKKKFSFIIRTPGHFHPDFLTVFYILSNISFRFPFNFFNYDLLTNMCYGLPVHFLKGKNQFRTPGLDYCVSGTPSTKCLCPRRTNNKMGRKIWRLK